MSLKCRRGPCCRVRRLSSLSEWGPFWPTDSGLGSRDWFSAMVRGMGKAGRSRRLSCGRCVEVGSDPQAAGDEPARIAKSRKLGYV